MRLSWEQWNLLGRLVRGDWACKITFYTQRHARSKLPIGMNQQKLNLDAGFWTIGSEDWSTCSFSSLGNSAATLHLGLEYVKILGLDGVGEIDLPLLSPNFTIDLGFGPGFSLDKPELGREWINVDGTKGADHPSGARMMRSWTVFLHFFWPSSRRFYKLVDFSIIHLTTFSEDWPPLYAVCFRMTGKAFQQTKSEDIFRPKKSESGFKRFTNFRV